jgi:hypothetical protein
MTEMQKAALRRAARKKIQPGDMGEKPDYTESALEDQAMKEMPGEYRGENVKKRAGGKDAIEAAAKRRAQRRAQR